MRFLHFNAFINGAIFICESISPFEENNTRKNNIREIFNFKACKFKLIACTY